MWLPPTGCSKAQVVAPAGVRTARRFAPRQGASLFVSLTQLLADESVSLGQQTSTRDIAQER